MLGRPVDLPTGNMLIFQHTDFTFSFTLLQINMDPRNRSLSSAEGVEMPEVFL